MLESNQIPKSKDFRTYHQKDLNFILHKLKTAKNLDEKFVFLIQYLLSFDMDNSKFEKLKQEFENNKIFLKIKQKFGEPLKELVIANNFHIDKKLLMSFLVYLPVLIERDAMKQSLELYKDTFFTFNEDLENIIDTVKTVNAKKSAFAKIEKQKILLQPLKEEVIHAYLNPQKFNRTKWKSRNEFSQIFCMNYNRNLKKEEDYLLDSTVKKWIKDFLESN